VAAACTRVIQMLDGAVSNGAQPGAHK
jgi:hypothetical protein